MTLSCDGVSVWLLCGFIILSVSNVDPNKECVFRKTCMGIEYDPREFVCCGNKLHPGTGLSCCGEKAFNPNVATCCKEGQGSTLTATVTLGLSEKVSACCGLKAYNPLNEICCQSRVIAKPGSMARCCGERAFDVENQLCCGPTHDKKIMSRASSHHQCCGHNQYDTTNQCCCWMENIPQIQHIHSKCCAENLGFDKDKHLFCGPLHNKKILTQNSSHHQCCGHDQYDTKTECCCWTHEIPTVQLLGSSCCAKVSSVPLRTPTPKPNCSEPNTSLCGSSCYNPNEFQCCERSQTKQHFCCHSGHCDAAPTIFNPLTHICCDGCVSEQKPWSDKCCGQTPYGLAQRRVLCCLNTLYKDREDGEECSEINIPYNPAKGTMCCSQFHGSPGQHCCGTELYQPHSEICCDGHRHPKEEHSHCCGIRAYNINDPQMKCCGGTLYNLTSLGKSGHDAQCCGSIVQKNHDVCCSSEDTELLYSNKTGYRCCGHLYYNISLWSCCAGKLSHLHQPGQRQDKMATESTFLSVNNLNKRDLCKEIKTGTLESVSPHSIVFNNVVIIHGMQATVKALPSSYILKTPNRCIFPKLIPGKTYFFDNAKVFTGFNHNFLQAVHFIMSKCYHP